MANNYCIGFTTKGKACKNVAKGSLYCRLHTKDQPFKTPSINFNQIILNNINLIKSFEDGKGSPEVKTINILDECPICCDPIYEDNDAKLDCNHKYCFNCVVQLHTPNCPSCRADLKSPKINENVIKNILKRNVNDQVEQTEESLLTFLESEIQDQIDAFAMEDLNEDEEFTIYQQLAIIMNLPQEEVNQVLLLDFYTSNMEFFRN
jgi:hypothetical protein